MLQDAFLSSYKGLRKCLPIRHSPGNNAWKRISRYLFRLSISSFFNILMMVGYQVILYIPCPVWSGVLLADVLFPWFCRNNAFYIGIGNQSCCSQALQCTVADFQECAYFITVHPDFILVFRVLLWKHIIGYHIYLSHYLLIGFWFNRNYIHIAN